MQAPCITHPTSGNTDRCYACSQEGHYAKEYPTVLIKPEVALVHDDLYKDSGLLASESEEELELEEPGKEQP